MGAATEADQRVEELVLPGGAIVLVEPAVDGEANGDDFPRGREVGGDGGLAEEGLGVRQVGGERFERAHDALAVRLHAALGALALLALQARLVNLGDAEEGDGLVLGAAELLVNADGVGERAAVLGGQALPGVAEKELLLHGLGLEGLILARRELCDLVLKLLVLILNGGLVGAVEFLEALLEGIELVAPEGNATAADAAGEQRQEERE